MAQVFPATLDYEQSYPCPVCRNGQLDRLILMDAFACSICHHIFSANLNQQSICLADRTPALGWRWAHPHWRPLHHPDIDFPLGIWILCGGLTILPPTILGVMHHMFPPLDSSAHSFPLLWIGIVGLTHGLIALWILAEFYQLPLYLSWKFRWQS